MAKRPTRFMAIYDSHGDMVDPSAERAAREFCDDFKPQVRIAGGDHFDLRSLRSGASQEDKQEGVTADVEAGLSLLAWFKPTVWLVGNHDHRLYRVAKDSRDGNLKALANLLINRIEDDLDGVEIVPYGKRRGVWEWGGYKWMHGYSAGVHAVAKMAQVYGDSVCGHNHTPIGPVPAVRDDGAKGYGSGCLCKLEHDYNAGHLGTIRQGHGFLYGWLNAAGRAVIHHATPMDGMWPAPLEFRDAKRRAG